MLVVEKQWMYGIRKYWIGLMRLNGNRRVVKSWRVPRRPKGELLSKDNESQRGALSDPSERGQYFIKCFLLSLTIQLFSCSCMLSSRVSLGWLCKMFYRTNDPEPDRKQEKCFLQLNCSCNEIISIKPPFQAGIFRKKRRSLKLFGRKSEGLWYSGKIEMDPIVYVWS